MFCRSAIYASVYFRLPTSYLLPLKILGAVSEFSAAVVLYDFFGFLVGAKKGKPTIG